MIVTLTNPRRLVAGVPLAAGDFVDLPQPCIGIGWDADGNLAVQFANNLSVADQAKVRRRCMSVNANEELLRERAEAYLALPAPTAAQTLAAVKALVRLQLDQLDGT